MTQVIRDIKIECPFRNLEFPDLRISEDGGHLRIDEIEMTIRLVQYKLQTDPKLFAALDGVLRLLGALDVFLESQEERYGQLGEEFDKRRALAEACRLAKALSENRELARSQKQNSIAEGGSQQAENLDDKPGQGCMMPDICMSGSMGENEKSLMLHIGRIEDRTLNVSSIIDLLKSMNPDLRDSIEFHGLASVMHEQTNAILDEIDKLSHLIKYDQKP